MLSVVAQLFEHMFAGAAAISGWAELVGRDAVSGPAAPQLRGGTPRNGCALWGRTLLARRISDTNQRRSRSRSRPMSWPRRSGDSPRETQRELETSNRLEQHQATAPDQPARTKRAEARRALVSCPRCRPRPSSGPRWTADARGP
ncbi:MAG: hypothetical protein ICV70_08190 [Jiangellaceae bacterium]|nr:hypothetical protein [Jiangellaceae bacterium]